MFCVECGGSPGEAATPRRRVKLRPTGRPDQPFVVVCDRCGCDLVPAGTAGRNSDPEQALRLFGMHPEVAPLLRRSG